MGKVKIFDFTTLRKQLENIICDEIYKVFSSYPDIFTEKYKDIFSVSFTNTTILFVEDELFPSERKTFSRKFIVNMYNDSAYERNSTPMIAHMYGNVDKKKNLKISKLLIRVNTDILVEEALSNMWDIDNWIEIFLKQEARHEAGHIIDYISYDGKKDSLFIKNDKKNKKEKEAWREWWKATVGDPPRTLTDDEERLRLEKYFNIPNESIADMYGKVDRAKSIDYQFKNHKRRIDVVIRTHVRKDKTKKESKNE